MLQQPGQTGDAGGGSGEESMEFPVTNLYKLDSRVFKVTSYLNKRFVLIVNAPPDNWSIPYKREESLGKCLVAATKLAAEGLLEQDEHCKKFIERVSSSLRQQALKSPLFSRLCQRRFASC